MRNKQETMVIKIMSISIIITISLNIIGTVQSLHKNNKQFNEFILKNTIYYQKNLDKYKVQNVLDRIILKEDLKNETIEKLRQAKELKKAREIAIQEEIKKYEEKQTQERIAKANIPSLVQNHQSRGGNYKYTKRIFKLSFYTSLPSENGGYTGNCHGQPLKYGMVASNVIPQKTVILLDGFGEMQVLDRGGKHFNSYDRLDVLIERNKGESNSQYLKRVNDMGRIEKVGYIVEKQ